MENECSWSTESKWEAVGGGSGGSGRASQHLSPRFQTTGLRTGLRSEFPKGRSARSWQEKGKMNAGGQQRKTVTPGFPSASLAASFSHPMDIGFP